MRVGLVLVVAAACGDGATPPDATIPIDAPAGRVTVRSTDNDPTALQVLFQDADSKLVLATRIGPDGTANAYMAPGGFVTLVFRAGGVAMFTWTDVQPGDELLFSIKSNSSPGTHAASFTLDLPPDPGQTQFTLSTSCGDQFLSTGLLPTVTLENCAEREDMLVVSRDGTFGDEHYLFAPGVAIDTTTVTMPGPWRELEAARLEVTGAPAEVTSMNGLIQLVDGRHPLGQSARGNAFLIDGGAGAMEVEAYVPPDARALVAVTPSFSPDAISTQRRLRWGPAEPVTRFDLSAGALRRYREFPTYVKASHTIRWTEETDGARADGVLATFGWLDFTALGQYQWTVMAPARDEPAIELPVLPLEELRLGASADIQHPFILTTFEIDGGFERLRRTLPITWTSSEIWPIDTPEGGVVIQELGSPQFPF